METYPSYSAMMDNACMMEIGKKDDSEFRKKRKQGFEGKPIGHDGALRNFKPPT